MKIWSKIVESWREWRFQALKRKATNFLSMVDRHMAHNKWPREKRRQFWREFTAKAETRADFVKQLSKPVKEKKVKK
jgi:hypothetical protein